VEGVAPVTVNTWSASSTVALSASAVGAVSVELAVTVDEGDDVAISGVEALSVTVSSNV